MSVREYIGARYVPIFGRKDETSIDWDDTKPYEPLTIVLHEGNSYTSRQYVPAGIPITNQTYWALTGNYNAQVEAYRAEVQGFADDIQANADAITAINGEIGSGFTSENTIADAINGIDGEIGDGFTSEHTIADTVAEIQDDISDMQDDIEDLQEVIGVSYSPVTRNYNGRNMVVLGDSYTAPGIDNSADAYWPRRVAAAYGMNLFNYAVGGAGWGRASNLIETQQTACDNALTPSQKENTAVVIAMAGVNDLLNDVDSNAIQSGMTSFMVWANREFPNAQIIMAPFVFGFGGITDTYRATITNTMNGVFAYDQYPGVKIMRDCYMWNLGLPTRFRNQVHPNESGYRVIAGHIINAIEGGDPINVGTASHTDLSGITGIGLGAFNYYVADGMCHIHGYARPSTAGATQVTIYSSTGTKAPRILTPYYPDAMYIPAFANTAGAANAVMVLEKNGNCVIKFPSAATTSTLYQFDYSYPVACGISWTDAM